MGIEKFLGIGLEGGGELSEMGDEVMADMMKELKPLFEKIGKPFLKPAFESIKQILGGTEEKDKPGKKKYMVLDLNQKTGVVVFYLLEKGEGKTRLEAPMDCVIQAKPIEDPVAFMEQLMSGQLIEKKKQEDNPDGQK